MSNLPAAPPVDSAVYRDTPDHLHRGADAAIGCALVLFELVALMVCVAVWPFVDHIEHDPAAPQRPYVFWDYAPAIGILGAVVVVIGVLAAKGRATITAISQIMVGLLVAAVLVVGSVAQRHEDHRNNSAPAPTGRAWIAPPGSATHHTAMQADLARYRTTPGGATTSRWRP
ncbi:DUF6234 family protein [Streptomyces sp. NPDC056670]|uniref:DUF6234 family protein n=1 Tax=Streptomyces sp. NPDC056670 TaxID=3345904 RepID=UPI00367A40EC